MSLYHLITTLANIDESLGLRVISICRLLLYQEIQTMSIILNFPHARGILSVSHLHVLQDGKLHAFVDGGESDTKLSHIKRVALGNPLLINDDERSVSGSVQTTIMLELKCQS